MLFDYVIKNGKRLRDTTSNLTTVLAQDEAQNICIGLRAPDEVLARYTVCIDKMKKIIAEIKDILHIQSSDNIKSRSLNYGEINEYNFNNADLAIRSQHETYFYLKRKNEELQRQ